MIFIIILLTFLLPFSKPAFAQTATPTSTPTITPTSTPTSTLTPTPTPTTAPITGISLSEFLANPVSGFEWVELYNSNDFEVQLTGWKIFDSTDTSKSIPSPFVIPSKGYKSFDLGTANYLNNSGDKVRLVNNVGNEVDSYTYPNTSSIQYSWSKVSGSWCLAPTSRDAANNSCNSPTSTPAPTTTLTPTPTKKPTATPTPSPEPTAVMEPLPTDSPTIPPTSAPILVSANSNATAPSNNKESKNIIPGLFIGFGALLLLAPLAIVKIKSLKTKVN